VYVVRAIVSGGSVANVRCFFCSGGGFVHPLASGVDIATVLGPWPLLLLDPQPVARATTATARTAPEVKRPVTP
jgi:hypothetical protein